MTKKSIVKSVLVQFSFNNDAYHHLFNYSLEKRKGKCREKGHLFGNWSVVVKIYWIGTGSIVRILQEG